MGKWIVFETDQSGTETVEDGLSGYVNVRRLPDSEVEEMQKKAADWSRLLGHLRKSQEENAALRVKVVELSKDVVLLRNANEELEGLMHGGQCGPTTLSLDAELRTAREEVERLRKYAGVVYKELEEIRKALNDPRIDNTMTAAEVAAELRRDAPAQECPDEEEREIIARAGCLYAAWRTSADTRDYTFTDALWRAESVQPELDEWRTKRRAERAGRGKA